MQTKENTSEKIKPGEPEEDWIRRAASDPEAFRPLYEKYFKKVFLFILHRIGDKELAGDLSQQVFLKALTNIGKYQIRGFPFSAWLFRIAVNQCNDHFRKNHTRTVVLDDVTVEHLYEDLTAEQTMDEWKERLPAILQHLSAKDLQVIELRYFEERPFEEIAQILNISENSIKVRTYRALDRMKKLFLNRK